MSTPKIFESEYRFCLILWEHEPLPSAELAKLCKERLGWSRTTAYTVIHRLSERGIVKTKTASSPPSSPRTRRRRQSWTSWSRRRSKARSPAFIAAFARKTKLSQDEVDRLRAMIDGYEENRP